MIQIAQAQYLWILAFIPLLFLVYGMYRRYGRRMVKKFGDPELMKPLMPDVSRRRGWLKMVLFSLGLFFFVLGLSRPQTGARVKELKRTGVEIIIALDVSNSMLAEDYSPNRLERAKLAVSRLVDNLGRDRIGLIIFAGDAFVQLPVTTDYVSAKMFLHSISTNSVPKQGTAIGQAIFTGIRSFSPDTPGSRALIIISDGEDHEDNPVPMAQEAAEQGVQVHCIGIGSAEGKPIPMEDGSLLKDKDGDIVVTKLDEKTLMEVAEAGGGVYVRAGNSDFGLQGIIDEIRKMDEQEFQSVVFEDFNEQYMYFFGIALFFFLLDMLVGERKIRRFKSFDIFTKTLVLFLVFTGFSIVATAQSDKKDIRAGNRAFRKGDMEQALIDYQKAFTKDTTSLKAKYNLANVLHQMGQHEQAAKAMHTVPDSLQAVGQKADAWHNMGNFQLSQEDYAKSIEAYKDALRKRPEDYETKANLAYAQKMLKNQQENEDQDENRDQDEDEDQDQDQDQDRDQDREQPEPSITPQAAQQILEAMQQKEKETQDKIQKEKAKAAVPVRSDKNW